MNPENKSESPIRRFPRLPGIVSTPISNIPAKALRWLWAGRIPKGKITVLDGDPGVGKSLVSLDLAARISARRRLPFRPHSTNPPSGNVIILSAEDDTADTIRPRLEAAGADLARISIISTLHEDGEESQWEMPRDLAKLEADIRYRHAVLVIIDPLMAFVPSNVNTWRDQDVRRALAPLRAVAERTGAAILVIRHLNKMPGRNPLYRGGGSIGIIGAARSGLLIAPDPNNHAVKVLVPMKANLARKYKALCFSITTERVESVKGNIAKVQWLRRVEMTADELLNPDTRPLGKAIAFLQNILAHGQAASVKVEEAAKAKGISDRTLDRAKKQIQVKAVHKGFGDTGSWELSLPEAGPV